MQGLNWYCFVVEPGCQRQIENALAALGYRPFVPKVRKWRSHARQKTVVERALLGRYLFVEVDFPRQSFAPIMSTPGVEYPISADGVPWPMPRADVEDLLHRYMAGEFDEVTNAAVPIGGRVVITEGQFESWLATVTAREKGGRVTVKLLGKNVHVNRLTRHAVAPAFGFDLARDNSERVIKEGKK